MRHFIARSLSIVALGSTVACGSSGSSVPGSIANASGGGAALGGTQSANPLTSPPVLVDGGIVSDGTFTGANVVSTDTQSAADAGRDTYVPPAGTTYAFQPPADPAGSHLITFSTTAPSLEQIFVLSKQTSLTLDSTQSGVASSTTYGAIAFYSNARVDDVPTAGFDVEIYGGAGASGYDVRIGCAPPPTQSPYVTDPIGNAAGFDRYACALPKYGSPSGLYATVYSSTLLPSSKFLGATIQNPILPNAAGLFTPGVSSYPNPAPTPGGGGAPSSPAYPTIALVVDESHLTDVPTSGMALDPQPLPPSTGLTVDIDYMYAEPLSL